MNINCHSSRGLYRRIAVGVVTYVYSAVNVGVSSTVDRRCGADIVDQRPQLQVCISYYSLFINSLLYKQQRSQRSHHTPDYLNSVCEFTSIHDCVLLRERTARAKSNVI